MHGRRTITAATTAAALLLAGSTAALGATAGETVLLGGLPLPAGAIAGGMSGFGVKGAEQIAISADGRYVAFVATADGLSADAQPDVVNVYRKDRVTGAVALASRYTGVAGAGAAMDASDATISDDGSRVGWLTDATIDGGDLDDGGTDVYLRDFATDQTMLATPGTASDVDSYDLSGNGAMLAFATSERVTVGDGNGLYDVYRRRVSGGASTLVSWNAAGLASGDGASSDPTISGDGKWVAFSSRARNLVAGFVPGGGRDVFARDLDDGVSYVVSSANGDRAHGSNGADNLSADIAGSPASRAFANVFVAYTSQATNLAGPGEGTDNSTDSSVYRRQLSSASSQLVSRADGAGANADGSSGVPQISADGRLVAFTSYSANLGGGESNSGYVRDMTALRTTRVSADGSGATAAAISGGGTVVAWFQDNGITADSDPSIPGVFARTYASPPAALGAPELIGRPPSSAPFLAPAVQVGTPQEGARTISGDGRYVVFDASSNRLPGGSGTTTQVYRRDTLTGAIELVSRVNGSDGAVALGSSYQPTVSADGNRVAFVSTAEIDPADAGVVADEDVYVRDLAAGTTTLVSRADGFAGAKGDRGSARARISADGAHVVFFSTSGNLGVPSGDDHLFLRDLATGRLQLVDRAPGANGAVANANSDYGVPSADGRYVAFLTYANNLDPADSAPRLFADVYVRDTVAATTRLVSRRSGADGEKTTMTAYAPAISDDGRVVAMRTQDEALAPGAGPWDGVFQIVTRDLTTDTNTLVSRLPGGEVAGESADSPSLSADGSVVAFTSEAENLLPGRGGKGRAALFVRSASGQLGGPPAFGALTSEHSGIDGPPSVSADGQCVAFVASGHNAASGNAGDFSTLYMYVDSGICPKPVPVGDPGPPQVVPAREAGRPAPPAKPTLTKASLLRARFRVSPKATAVAAAVGRAGKGKKGKAKGRARRTPAGTAFRFTLNTRASVTIALERSTAGRKVGRSCRRPSRRLRTRKACVRWVAVTPALKRAALAGGKREIAFSGRIGKRALAAGSYRATLRAANAAGRSKPATVRFTVVRR